MTKLIFLDLETTGLDPKRHELWEIGLILRDDVQDTEMLFCVEPSLSIADPMALRISRYYERTSDLVSAIPGEWHDLAANDDTWPRWSCPGTLAASLARWLDGAVIVGNVPSFDVAFLDVFLRKYGQCLTTHYQPIDVEAMAIGFLHGSVAEAIGRGAKVDMQIPAPPWPSDVLTEALGLYPQSAEERHTALGDARYVRALYDTITEPPS